MQDLLDRASQDFQGVLDVLNTDLATVRTGRAKPEMVEGILVEAYEGQPKMQLRELASITSPDPKQLVVKPWDPSVLEQVEKALAASDLNLSPAVDGEIIRITLAALTEERRRDLVKLVKGKLESGKVLLRQARHRIKEAIDAREGKSDVSEDDIRKAVEGLNKLTDEYTGKIGEMGKVKEKALMTV